MLAPLATGTRHSSPHLYSAHPLWSGSFFFFCFSTHSSSVFLHLSSFVSPLPGSLSALCSASYFFSPVDRSRCPSLPTRDIPFRSFFPFVCPFRLHPLPCLCTRSNFIICPYSQGIATKRRFLSLLPYEARRTGFVADTNRFSTQAGSDRIRPSSKTSGVSATEKGGAASRRTREEERAFAGDRQRFTAAPLCPVTTADDTIRRFQSRRSRS